MTEFTKLLISNLVFSTTTIIALIFLLCIIFSKNPINIVLYLIAFFFDIAFLFIYCGVDYIAILILLLYAGAVSIILLFVIMLLDMKDLILKKDRVAWILGFLFIIFFFLVSFRTISLFYYSITHFMPRVEYICWVELFYEKTNIEVIGTTLYEFYIFQFVVIGIFLFIIMVMIISLIVNYNLLSKKQNLFKQLGRKITIKFND